MAVAAAIIDYSPGFLIGRSGVEVAFWSVAPAGWAQLPATALNINYLKQNKGVDK